ncbi:hypothetical protein BDV34DRAFT_205038 [Aspergillus parasiticus]|uniref:Uncharacterized protein n=1 Tax=Aspergillus parasiticus TaxID=5067 RepID=A0A5N6D524_ASPPA|nr:hypothetical protein BDV34DRAFT_205038 [Aspergillus parasiticus]
MNGTILPKKVRDLGATAAQPQHDSPPCDRSDRSRLAFPSPSTPCFMHKRSILCVTVRSPDRSEL